MGTPRPRTSNNCHTKLWLWLLVLGGLLWPISTRAASFNCSQAKHSLEVLICKDAELSSLDGQEGDFYYALRTTVPKGGTEAAGLLNEQREFLKNRTRTCPIPGNPVLSEADSNRAINCLKEFYTLRLNELRKRLAASGRRNGPTDQNAADIPSDLLAALRDDLAGDDECLEHLKENMRTTLFDLNQSQPAWLVEGLNCLAGANNGPKLCTFDPTMAGVRFLMKRVKIWKEVPLTRAAGLIWSSIRTSQQLKTSKSYISLMGTSTKRLAAMRCGLRDAARARPG